MHQRRNTKILATLGPASSTLEMITALLENGVNMFRINMSHIQKEEDFIKLYEMIRKAEQAHQRPVGILVDIQGPKLRIGNVKEGVFLEKGHIFILDQHPETGDQNRVYLPHQEIFAAANKGDVFLLDDGKLRLEVLENKGSSIRVQTLNQGNLLSRKGISLPDTLVALDILTPKDRENLAWVVKHDIDWLALSFVQQACDLEALRTFIKNLPQVANPSVRVMAKIEKPQALQCLLEILHGCDGVMVARGDLGVELPVWEVPGWQKRITSMARELGKPVVIATQMLESMISAPTPTRAEVSDVAQAVFDGADAVMLSAETASGSYPCEAVRVMHEIAKAVESEPAYEKLLGSLVGIHPERTSADAISAAAHSLVSAIRVACIVSYTTSGATALRMARERPLVPIVAFSPKLQTARYLTLAWGVCCVVATDPKTTREMIDAACGIAKGLYDLQDGESIVITAGMPMGTPGATNLIRLAVIGEKWEG